MSKSFVVALSLSLAAGAAHAQTVRTPVAPAPLTLQADMLKWQSAMVAAQQAAIKPGDEALPCEALHKELVSSMNAPAIQQYAAKTDAAYAKELAAQQKRGEMTAATAAALAASLASGPGMTGMADDAANGARAADDPAADAAGDAGAAAGGDRLHESARADHADADAQSARDTARDDEELRVGHRWSGAASKRGVARCHSGDYGRRASTVRSRLNLGLPP